MKNYILTFCLGAVLHISALAQNRLAKDLDNDQVNDTVYIDEDNSRVVCRLSSQKFAKMQSKFMNFFNYTFDLSETKNGFEFITRYPRAQYKSQFRFDAATLKMQLIGMTRYKYGENEKVGNIESSVNLLTGDYVGKWRPKVYETEGDFKAPTVQAKMALEKIFLETFDDQVYLDYARKCSSQFSSYEKIKLDHFDDLYFEELEKDLILYINGTPLLFSVAADTSKTEWYSRCSVSIESSAHYFNLKYTYQDGGSYRMLNNIFREKQGKYTLEKQYEEYSSRNAASLSGNFCNGVEIRKFKVDQDYDLENTTPKFINKVTGFQDENGEVETIDYYALVEKNCKAKKYKDVLLFTNEFVIDNLGIDSRFGIEQLNNIGYYACKSAGYAEAVYILEKVIAKSPDRAVAHLNLADAYWDSGEKEKAIASYQKYVQLMKDQKKDASKIPAYVQERVK